MYSDYYDSYDDYSDYSGSYDSEYDSDDPLDCFDADKDAGGSSEGYYDEYSDYDSYDSEDERSSGASLVTRAGDVRQLNDMMSSDVSSRGFSDEENRVFEDGAVDGIMDELVATGSAVEVLFGVDFPFTDVASVFNGEGVWVNIQRRCHPRELLWNFEDAECWMSIIPPRIKNKFGSFPPVYSKMEIPAVTPRIVPLTMRNGMRLSCQISHRAESLSSSILYAVVHAIMTYRRVHVYVEETLFHEPTSRVLHEIIEELAMWSAGPCTWPVPLVDFSREEVDDAFNEMERRATAVEHSPTMNGSRRPTMDFQAVNPIIDVEGHHDVQKRDSVAGGMSNGDRQFNIIPKMHRNRHARKPRPSLLTVDPPAVSPDAASDSSDIGKTGSLLADLSVRSNRPTSGRRLSPSAWNAMGSDMRRVDLDNALSSSRRSSHAGAGQLLRSMRKQSALLTRRESGISGEGGRKESVDYDLTRVSRDMRAKTTEIGKQYRKGERGEGSSNQVRGVLSEGVGGEDVGISYVPPIERLACVMPDNHTITTSLLCFSTLDPAIIAEKILLTGLANSSAPDVLFAAAVHVQSLPLGLQVVWVAIALLVDVHRVSG